MDGIVVNNKADKQTGNRSSMKGKQCIKGAVTLDYNNNFFTRLQCHLLRIRYYCVTVIEAIIQCLMSVNKGVTHLYDAVTLRKTSPKC